MQLVAGKETICHTLKLMYKIILIFAENVASFASSYDIYLIFDHYNEHSKITRVAKTGKIENIDSLASFTTKSFRNSFKPGNKVI